MRSSRSPCSRSWTTAACTEVLQKYLGAHDPSFGHCTTVFEAMQRFVDGILAARDDEAETEADLVWSEPYGGTGEDGASPRHPGTWRPDPQSGRGLPAPARSRRLPVAHRAAQSTPIWCAAPYRGATCLWSSCCRNW